MCFYCGNDGCRGGRICGSETPKRYDTSNMNWASKEFCEEHGIPYDKQKDLKRREEIRLSKLVKSKILRMHDQ